MPKIHLSVPSTTEYFVRISFPRFYITKSRRGYVTGKTWEEASNKVYAKYPDAITVSEIDHNDIPLENDYPDFKPFVKPVKQPKKPKTEA